LKRLALVCCLLFAACDDSSNSLSGSLSEIYGLDFDSVTVSELGSTIIVKYNRGSGANEATVIKFTADLTGLTVVPNQTIDLAELVSGQPRGALARLVETPIQLGLQRGLLRLDSAPAAGQTLSGQFNVELSDPSGRTLTGKFSGSLTVLQ
jgi:hypothetical protein